jgi:hypothetical protein
MAGHRVRLDLTNSQAYRADPGSGAQIYPERWGEIIAMAIAAGASETGGLPAPTRAGLRFSLFAMSVGASGSRVITSSTALDAAGNLTMTFNAADQLITLESVPVTRDTFEWRVVHNEGVAGPVASLPSAAITSGTITTLDVNTITTAAEAAEHGAGAIGTGAAPATYRRSENGIIITEIKVDLQGLASVATANDVIGLSAGGNAYIGRNVVAANGIIYKIELICVETPAGGDNDVNVVANASGALAYDGAGGTTYGVNGGDAVAGQVVENLVQGLTANHYFYLTAGTGDTAAAYTAGQFIVRLHGHAVLA